jgi:MFS family permease
MDVTSPNSGSSVETSGSPPRVVIVACMLAGMCTFLNVYDTQPLLPYLQQIFHASEIAVSLTVSATILAMALTAPFIGLLAESIGRKKVIVPSLYALTVPTLLAATSRTLHQLVFWRFMQGVFAPGVIVVIMAYINEEFPRRHVGKAMSAYVSGTVLG